MPLSDGETQKAYPKRGLSIAPVKQSSSLKQRRTKASVLKRAKATRSHGKHPKPSRSLSCYNFFVREERVRIMQEPATAKGATDGGHDSSNAFVAVGRLVAERWKQITQEERDRYQRMADEDMQRYQKDMQHYMVQELETDDSNDAAVAESIPSPAPAPSRRQFAIERSVLQTPFTYHQPKTQLYSSQHPLPLANWLPNGLIMNGFARHLEGSFQLPPTAWPNIRFVQLQAKSYTSGVGLNYREDPQVTVARQIALLRHQLANSIPQAPRSYCNGDDYQFKPKHLQLYRY